MNSRGKIFFVIRFIKTHWHLLLTGFSATVYALYFSLQSMARMNHFMASYFDLGIMHQTVYNTFVALKTADWPRLLELTNPHGVEQVTRIAIHNDLWLAPISLLYFVWSGPETLLVLQSVLIGSCAILIFLIGKHVLEQKLLPLVFALSFLLNPLTQRINLFDFHAVVFAMPLLLLGFLFYLKNRLRLSLLYFVLAMLAKEQIGLVVACFGFAIFASSILKVKFNVQKILSKPFWTAKSYFALLLIVFGLFWSLLSVFALIPYFRGGVSHFATERFAGVIGENPYEATTFLLWRFDTLTYFWWLLVPVAFLSLFSPFLFLVSAPEIVLNLLSENLNMRNIVFHYTAVILPWVYISALFGCKNITRVLKKYVSIKLITGAICLFVVAGTFWLSASKSPLPYSPEKDVYSLTHYPLELPTVLFWGKTLRADTIKIATTGHLAPFFTARRYFYDIKGENYTLADYVILLRWELDNSEGQNFYQKLQKNPSFAKIAEAHDLEIYQKKTP